MNLNDKLEALKHMAASGDWQQQNIARHMAFYDEQLGEAWAKLGREALEEGLSKCPPWSWWPSGKPWPPKLSKS